MKITIGRERKLPPFVLGLAAVAAFALAAAAPAAALPTPDAVALEHLRAAAAADNRYRVTTQRGQFVVGTLHADESGVVLTASEGRPALFVAPGANAGGRRASWAEIESIEGMHAHGARGMVIGALLGTVIGFGLMQAVEPGLHDAADVAIVLVPLGTVVGGGIGLLIGSAQGWERLYP